MLTTYRQFFPDWQFVPQDVLDVERRKFITTLKGNFSTEYLTVQSKIISDVLSSVDIFTYLYAYAKYTSLFINRLLKETSTFSRDRKEMIEHFLKAIFVDVGVVSQFYADESNKVAEAQRVQQLAIDRAREDSLKTLVKAVEAGFDRLSSGDLTTRITEAVAPEFEPIREKFNHSIMQLESTISCVVTAVGSMRSGLAEITRAAGDLSQRTEQQASSLEETVAALSDVVSGVNETAQSADDARSAATRAQQEAEKGGVVVSQAVAAMAEIEQSSDKIGQIIGVIDEIAFQTNLLALNADVEAARAGEAGRGFAVVAQEVRGLAQRSAEAAKEIKSLIATSSAQVTKGVDLVSASGRSLQQIVTQVGDVAGAISQMAVAAREQSVALKEVSVAAGQMDQVTQQNAAMVEETTAAAQILSAETEELANLVDGFRTASAAGISSKIASPKSIGTGRSVMQMRTTGTGGVTVRPFA